MALTWRKIPGGFVARNGRGGEYHVYRFAKGKRAFEATLDSVVIGLWSDAADAMADIDRAEARIGEKSACIA